MSKRVLACITSIIIIFSTTTTVFGEVDKTDHTRLDAEQNTIRMFADDDMPW